MSFKSKLKQNIWKFYLYRFFASLIFSAPIFVLFLLDNGLSMTQVMLLQAVYTALSMLFTVPAGLLADKIGRQKILACNSLFALLGWLVYASSHTFSGFLLAEILLALSLALWQAGSPAFIYDTLKELKEEKQFKKVYGHIVTINNLVWGLAALLGSYLATFSLRLPFWFSLPPLALALFLAFTFTETRLYPHGEKHYLVHLKDAARFTFSHPKLRLFLIYAAFIFSLSFITYLFYQPYLETIKIPLAYFGLVYFLLSLAYALGSQLAHPLESKLGEKKILILLLLAHVLSLLALAFLIPFWGAVIIIVLSFFGGLFEPVILDYINRHVETHHRATVNSLGSLLNQGLSTLLAPFLGWVSDLWGLSTAFLLSALLLALNLGILLAIFYLLKKD